MDNMIHYIDDAHSQNDNQLVDPNDDIDDADDNVSEENNTMGLDVSIPKEGMLFSTDEDAYDFYNAFAKKRGFGVRRGASARGEDGAVIRRIFVCSREGFKYDKYKRKDGREVKPRKSKRDGCCARIHVHRCEDGLWKVKYFIDRHNHLMITSPSDVAKLRSHGKPRIRRVNEPLVVPLEVARPINVRICDTSEENIGNVRFKRENNLTHQCRSMVQQLVRKQATESGFFYTIQIDDDCYFRSVFWSDWKSRMSYMQFSDVVVFDVAYTPNSFVLPLVTITGVNHHKKPTLFGCALLADAQEETFVWLFETMASLWGKAPGTIITKQEPAICNAIKNVFPDTRYRFCMQHISLLEDEYLQALRSSYNPWFDEDYQRWVRTSQSIEEAEKCWLSLKEKFMIDFDKRVSQKQINELKAWDWLESMHEIRHHWVEAYLKDIFTAGIKSSQNSYFNSYVNSMTPVQELIVQYDKASSYHRENEEREDNFCLRTKPFQGKDPLEGFAARVYTKNIFDNFLLEFKSILFCRHEKVGMFDGFNAYKVVSKMNGKPENHLVKCKVSDKIYLCTCSKFETEGVLCRHVLYIMKQIFQLQLIPERYILARWTLNTSPRLNVPTNINGEKSENSGNVAQFEAWLCQVKLDMVYEKAIKDRECYEFTLELVEEFWKQVDLNNSSGEESNTGESVQVGSSVPSVPGSLSSAKAITQSRRMTIAGTCYGLG